MRLFSNIIRTCESYFCLRIIRIFIKAAMKCFSKLSYSSLLVLVSFIPARIPDGQKISYVISAANF